MAEFSRGDFITAENLNAINAKEYRAVSFPGGADWIHDYLGNDGICYSHVPAGSVVFKMRMDCGWFGGGKLIVERLDAEGNVLNTLYNTEHSWNTHTTITVNSVGPGWYRARSGTAFQIDATTLYCYAYQTDCQQGQPLVLWDDPLNSGNRKTGSLLDVEALNSGLCGTLN